MAKNIYTEKYLRRHFCMADEDIAFLKKGRTIPTGVLNGYLEFIEEGEHKGKFRVVYPEMSEAELYRRYGPGGPGMFY